MDNYSPRITRMARILSDGRPLISVIRVIRGNNSDLNCSGAGLIGIIIAIVVMGMLGGSVLMLITTGSMESLQALNWNKAFFTAESGISKAREYMATNGSLPWTYTGSIGSAAFDIVITTNAASNVVVSSTGIYGDPPSRWTSKWRPTEILRAIIMYKQTTLVSPRYRTYSNRGLSDESTASSVSTRIRWQRIEANPRINEFLLVTEDNNRWVYAQIYTNGAWNASTRLNAAGRLSSAATRCFDVAYESLSGRGMVVYSIGSPTPQYQIWNSNGWTAAMPIPINANDDIQWIRLISKPNANEIMCLARWRKTTNPGKNRNHSNAIIWNGAAWTDLTNLEYSCNSDIDCETFDAAYSSNSAMVVYINGPTTDEPKSRTYISGVWSAETTMGSVDDDPSWIRVEYSADGAQAYACILQASRYLRGAYWNGTSWSSYNLFSDVQLDTINYRCFDIAWSSQTNTLMVAYSLNQDAQSYLLATDGGSSNQYGNLASTDDGQWCVLKADPFTSDFYCLAQDDKQDVNFQRWNGTVWTNFPELEDNTRDNLYNFTDFSFCKYRAP